MRHTNATYKEGKVTYEMSAIKSRRNGRSEAKNLDERWRNKVLQNFRTDLKEVNYIHSVKEQMSEMALGITGEILLFLQKRIQ